MKNADALRQLIDACIDDERMLVHESRTVQGGTRALLERLAKERAEVIAALEDLDNNEPSAHTGSWRERGRELGRELRTALGDANRGDSIAACIQSCRRAEERFGAALELDWPIGIRSVLLDQRTRLEEAHAALVAISY